MEGLREGTVREKGRKEEAGAERKKERMCSNKIIIKVIIRADLNGRVLTFPYFIRPQRLGETELG